MCEGHHNKSPQTGWFEQHICFPIFLKTGSPRSKRLQDWFLLRPVRERSVRGLSPWHVHDCLLTAGSSPIFLLSPGCMSQCLCVCVLRLYGNILKKSEKNARGERNHCQWPFVLKHCMTDTSSCHRVGTAMHRDRCWEAGTGEAGSLCRFSSDFFMFLMKLEAREIRS